VEHPSELSFFLKLNDDIIECPIPIQDGYITVADALAVRVDPARLQAASAV
jgi:L-Ala-D/L-Glu epimerase